MLTTLRQLTTPLLISSPTFNRMVRGVHKKVHEMRHGPSMEETGGTNSERGPSLLSPGQAVLIAVYADPEGSSASKFIQHFRDEIRDQLRGNTTKK